MHKAAHNKPRSRATGQMQRGTFLHIKMPGQAALGKEVCGKLNSTAETRPNHSCAHATVHTLDTFARIDLTQTIK